MIQNYLDICSQNTDLLSDVDMCWYCFDIEKLWIKYRFCGYPIFRTVLMWIHLGLIQNYLYIDRKGNYVEQFGHKQL